MTDFEKHSGEPSEEPRAFKNDICTNLWVHSGIDDSIDVVWVRSVGDYDEMF